MSSPTVLFCQRKTMFVVQGDSVSTKEQVLSHGTLIAWERRDREIVFDMNEPRLKLVWANGTWLSTQKKTTGNSAAETGRPASLFVRGWAWLRLNGSAISALVLLVGVPWYLGRSYVQLEKVNKGLNGDAGLIKSVDRLRNDIVWMKGFVSGTYGEKAVAEGYKKDEVKILPMSFLESQLTGKLLFQAAETVSGQLQYKLEVTVLRATREEIVMSVSRELGRADFKNNTVKVPLTTGATFELTKEAYVQGLPRIFFSVLEIPTQDTAIVAIGPKGPRRS